MKPDRDWVVAEITPSGGYAVRCLRCGAREVLKVPAPIEAFALRMKAFGLEHERCPVPSPSAPKETPP